MHNLSRFLLALVFVGACTFSIHAQTVTNVEAKIVEDDLVVSYQVSGILETQRFRVLLYGSHNSFSEPISGDDVTGKIGDRVALGQMNEIVISNPLEVLQGVTNISFRIKVDLVSYPVTLIEPQPYLQGFDQRRKRNMEVIWKGGLVNEPVKFDLYRYDSLVRKNFHSITNGGSTEFKLPKVDKGEGYVMKMNFESLPDPVALPPMKVKAKKSVFSRIFGISFLLAAVDFTLYAVSEDGPQDELGGFIFKNFDPLGKATDPAPGPEPTDVLPDPPNPGSRRAMFTITF